MQVTGGAAFRQSHFLDFEGTPEYNSRFLIRAFCVAESGGVAQLGERLNGIQEVRGSIPLASIAGRVRGVGGSKSSL
jgi:hypothetical protein